MIDYKKIFFSFLNSKLVIWLIAYTMISFIFLLSLFHFLDDYLKKQSLHFVNIMASSIDYRAFSRLEGNKNDALKSEYFDIKNLLRKLKNTSENYRFVYLLGKNIQDSIFFFVDSEIIGSPDESLPGDIYKDAPIQVLETFRMNDGNFTDKYKDKWGEWITAYYPIRLNNVPIALLAVDIDADLWDKNIRQLLVLPYILVFIGFFWIFFYYRHKKNRARLIESTTQLDTFFSSDSLYVIKIDIQGNYTYVNNSFQKRYGWLNNNKSLLGLNALKTIIPEDHQRIIETTRQCIANPGLTFQITLRKPDEMSNYRTNLWELTYIQNNDTNTNEILGIGKDISNIDELEKELIFEKDLFSSGPVITLIWNNDDFWTVKYTSKNIQTVLGYSIDEFVNSKFSNYIHPDDIDRINKEVDSNIIRRINNFEQSYRIKKKDETYIWVFDLTRIYRDEHGIITEIREYIYDQTRSKEYEEKLKNQNILLEGILRGTNAGTWDWNIQTGDLQINERWASLIGYNLDELLPITVDTWAKTLHPDDLIMAREELEKHFTGESDYYDVIFRQLHKNGDNIWINSRGKVIQKDSLGNPLRIQGTHIDMTAHIEALHKLNENENLLRSFISNVNGIAFLVDKDGIFRLSEGLGLSGLNMKPSDVLGKSMYQVYKGENELITQIEDTLNGKSGIKTLKLNNKYFETNFSPIRNEKGIITGAIGISIDVTEKYKVEENLKKLNIAIE